MLQMIKIYGSGSKEVSYDRFAGEENVSVRVGGLIQRYCGSRERSFSCIATQFYRGKRGKSMASGEAQNHTCGHAKFPISRHNYENETEKGCNSELRPHAPSLKTILGHVQCISALKSYSLFYYGYKA